MSTERQSIHRADKAVLRLTVGLGLAVIVAYGLALPAPFIVCVMTVLLLVKPGPPIAPAKGVVLALVVGILLAAGRLLVPVLQHYAVTGVAITGALLYVVFFAGARRANPLTIILVIAFTVIPVAGVAQQVLATALSFAFAVGLGMGILVSAATHAFFADAPRVAPLPVVRTTPDNEAAAWSAMRATVVVLPVFVLALTNPALYLAAIIKSVTLGQQACSTRARTAGRELVGSTLMGAAMAAVVWAGLSLRPNLWMLALWIMAAALWSAARLYGVKATSSASGFWSNALVTMLILLGPAIEDSANGKDVFAASVTRVALFVAVAVYAWVTVWVLEQWEAARSRGRAARAVGVH